MPAARSTAAGVNTLLQYYGPLRQFLAEGGTASAAWGELQYLESQGGPELAGATIFDMNEVAARARQDINAQAAFAAADPLQAMDSSMIADAPWLGSAGVGLGLGGHQIRGSLDLEGLALDQPIYMTVEFPGDISQMSPAEIIDYAVEQMQARLDQYDEDQLAALGIEGGLTITGLTDVQVFRL